MIEDAANMDAVHAARRFPIVCREQLYESFIEHGKRAIQLAHSFPALALLTYCAGARLEWSCQKAAQRETAAMAEVAAYMVGRGVEMSSRLPGS